jgi:hypothetical protein
VLMKSVCSLQRASQTLVSNGHAGITLCSSVTHLRRQAERP